MKKFHNLNIAQVIFSTFFQNFIPTFVCWIYGAEEVIVISCTCKLQMNYFCNITFDFCQLWLLQYKTSIICEFNKIVIVKYFLGPDLLKQKKIVKIRIIINKLDYMTHLHSVTNNTSRLRTE